MTKNLQNPYYTPSSLRSLGVIMITEGHVTFPLLLPHPLILEGHVTFTLMLPPLITEGNVTFILKVPPQLIIERQVTFALIHHKSLITEG